VTIDALAREQPKPVVTRPATRLRSLPVPITEPRAAERIRCAARWAAAPTQGTLALAMPPVPLGWDDDEPLLTPTAELPDPTPWVTQFVQAALEVATGLRSPAQLIRWTSDDVFHLLARRHALATRGRRSATSGRRPVVRAVRICRLRDGVVEASAVVMAERDRAQAVALRIEGVEGRWRATVLMIG
jgi:hypothetical protein